ncbi:MAG: protein-export chaperone SecB [Alphaproteobacteria bacterium]|jgi:preprotein translocase subunit SecB|nr:protein-export chaperone SecB [Alphaproteobacteria bacterium]MDP7221685.1 protein-export chaperone SecB [Alphaproteobacteria bacterium]
MAKKKKDDTSTDNSKVEAQTTEDKAAQDAAVASDKAASDETASGPLHGGDTPHDFPAVIQGQYIKDLSFESPRAPLSIMPGQKQPELNVNFGLAYRKLSEKEGRAFYEVVTMVKVTAKREDNLVFLIELQHGTSCIISEPDTLSEEELEQFLLTELPRYSFPFIRQLIATLTAQSGFTPLYLAPVNFVNLYKQRKAQQAQQGEQDESAAAQNAG